MLEHLTAQPDLGPLLAVVAADHTDAAALHTMAAHPAAAEGARPALVLVDACASWAAVAAAPCEYLQLSSLFVADAHLTSFAGSLRGASVSDGGRGSQAM